MEKVINEDVNSRIDAYLSEQLEYSRSKIVKMISDGTILVNGRSVKNSYLIYGNKPCRLAI